MTLYDDIISDASSVFLDVTNGFAETLTLYKGGQNEYDASGTSFPGVWDAGSEQGDNTEPGDGHNLEKPIGRRIRRTVMIECLATLDVDDRRDPPDKIKRGSEIVTLKRIENRDQAMMTLRCVRNDVIRSRAPQRTG